VDQATSLLSTRRWSRRKLGSAQGRPIRLQWVFGGVDLNTWDFFMEIVPRRDAATLMPVIQRNILPGTCIWSDEWWAYHQLLQLGCVDAALCQPVDWCTMYILTTQRPAGRRARRRSNATTEWCTSIFRHTSMSTKPWSLWTIMLLWHSFLVIIIIIIIIMWRARRPHSSMAVFDSIIAAIRAQCSNDASTSFALFRAMHFLQKKATWHWMRVEKTLIKIFVRDL